MRDRTTKSRKQRGLVRLLPFALSGIVLGAGAGIASASSDASSLGDVGWGSRNPTALEAIAVSLDAAAVYTPALIELSDGSQLGTATTTKEFCLVASGEFGVTIDCEAQDRKHGDPALVSFSQNRPDDPSYFVGRTNPDATAVLVGGDRHEILPGGLFFGAAAPGTLSLEIVHPNAASEVIDFNTDIPTKEIFIQEGQ